MSYRGAKSGVVNDLVLLDGSGEQEIVEALAARHRADEIYTYIGEVLLVVNPYRLISGLYGSSKIRSYVSKKLYERPPHVYGIAEMAYRSMMLNTSNECVIITGESGAGKTEASKTVMEYVAAMASKSKQVQHIKDELLQTNPLLEAFGNAKTRRNDNSSRFGKYFAINFLYGDPSGGSISTYLLEKTRVTHQQEGERNFHIFYQLLSDSRRRGDFKLSGSPGDYNFFGDPGAAKVRSIDDARDFSETTRAMDFIGMGGDEQNAIFAILAAILHLGNVEFESRGRDASDIVNARAVSEAASLLGVNERDLSTALTHRTVKSGTESVRTSLSAEKAAFARDSLAKSLYGRLFDHIVARCNETIHTEQFSTCIGVLDIYGFEILGVNGFEQLCINYTNEKLHALFIELTLKGEQAEYKRENISWVPVEFFDNTPIVELVDRRGGLFSLIDEQSIFPQATDATLFQKFQSNIRARELSVPRGAAPGEFEIRHYAGTVLYNTEGMLEANKDTLFPDLVLVVYHTARNPIAKDLFADHPAVDAGRKTNKRPPTTCMQYKKSVADLMDTLRSNNQHYIRCIKPNESKRAGMFEGDMVITQVRYLGIAENLIVRRAGYAFRMTYDEFAAKFKCAVAGTDRWEPNTRKATEDILRKGGVKHYELGRTKVFIKDAKDLLRIEDARRNFLETAAEYLPEDDGLIGADRVIAFNAKAVRVPLLLVVGSKGLYLYDPDGRQTEHHAAFSEVDSLAFNEKEGWIAALSTYPGKHQEDPEVQVTYLMENIHISEVRNWVEVLSNVGVDLPLTASSSYPMDAVDGPAYKANLKLVGSGALNLPAIRNGGGAPAGGCCVIA
ncbi:Unconventional myosin-Ia [Hondaea fermentalgiana]|uniref:Unconventional myosin-Ia n=1 Tax=Hondaea fermentalgiana TaxID=2315210 RepID=A0A2R5GT61_9STRA|nr:Unconventional myosin-Ia [Hondaea fermentalgiana]|eukprot:GBG34030.1 Unconventional myosin-Ia [Hondaea fermentalgiana]